MQDTPTKNSNEHENPSIWEQVTDNFRVRMLAGILLLVPVVVTIFVLQLLVGIFEPLISPIAQLSKSAETPRILTMIISAVTLICLIYLTGVLSAHMFGKRLMRLAEKALLRIPVVKNIYSATKQAVDLLSQSDGTAFKSVVLIEFPSKGSKSIAFMIGTITDNQGKTFCKVLLPSTPSPTTSFLLLVSPELVELTNISVEDGIKMIVSGGIISPEKITLSPVDLLQK